MASQQPHTNEPRDRRRVELTMDYWDISEKSLFRVFIWEAKKNKVSPSDIENLEYQAYESCLTHLKCIQRSHMYAITTIGTSARLWIVHVDEDYPIPWIPGGTGLADKSNYIEAHSSRGDEIVSGWA